MELIKNISKTLSVFIILSNIFLYYYTKIIKKKKKCLKKKDININHNTFKLLLVKYSSLFVVTLIVLNYFIPIHKIITKIPIISGLYSFSILILLTLQTYGFISTFNKIYIKNGIDCILNIPLKYKISKFIIKYKYKVSLSYIFLTYIGIIHL